MQRKVMGDGMQDFSVMLDDKEDVSIKVNGLIVFVSRSGDSVSLSAAMDRPYSKDEIVVELDSVSGMIDSVRSPAGNRLPINP